VENIATIQADSIKFMKYPESLEHLKKYKKMENVLDNAETMWYHE